MSALPFSNENEQGLLGSVLQDAAMVVPEVFYEYPQPKLLFHDFRHAEIFTGAAALVDDGGQL